LLEFVIDFEEVQLVSYESLTRRAVVIYKCRMADILFPQCCFLLGDSSDMVYMQCYFGDSVYSGKWNNDNVWIPVSDYLKQY